MQEAKDERLVSIQDQVREHFGWALKPDQDSAEALVQRVDALALDHPIWSKQSRSELLTSISAKLNSADKVVIVGAAVEQSQISESHQQGVVFIAADGSIGAFTNYDQLACIVSDFDGGEHLAKAVQSQVDIVAHAHGDNVARWSELLPIWKLESVGLVLSHQCPDRIDGMHNFGGFSDGDRAICFALACGVELEKIELIGYSMQAVGQWSGISDPQRKLEKLKWMQKVLQILNLERFLN